MYGRARAEQNVSIDSREFVHLAGKTVKRECPYYMSKGIFVHAEDSSTREKGERDDDNRRIHVANSTDADTERPLRAYAMGQGEDVVNI